MTAKGRRQKQKADGRSAGEAGGSSRTGLEEEGVILADNECCMNSPDMAMHDGATRLPNDYRFAYKLKLKYFPDGYTGKITVDLSAAIL